LEWGHDGITIDQLMFTHYSRKDSETGLTGDALIDNLAVVGESVTTVHPSDVHCDTAVRSSDAHV